MYKTITQISPYANQRGQEREETLKHGCIIISAIIGRITTSRARGERQPLVHVELVYDGTHEYVCGQLGGAHLQKVEVGVYHRVAEVALDVRHGLAFDLETVANLVTKNRMSNTLFILLPCWDRTEESPY